MVWIEGWKVKYYATNEGTVSTYLSSGQTRPCRLELTISIWASSVQPTETEGTDRRFPIVSFILTDDAISQDIGARMSLRSCTSASRIVIAHMASLENVMPQLPLGSLRGMVHVFQLDPFIFLKGS